MPNLWMPGVKVVRGVVDGGSMTGGEALVTWHYFVAPKTMSAVNGAKYLVANRKEVHFTFNVLTGEIVQMLPANRAGRGLRNLAGGVQTNRRGSVNLQVEVMANEPDWWRYMTPAGREGLAKLMEFFRSWGVPDRWVGQPGVSNDTPNGRSGHTGHYNWVENNHHDYLSKAPWELLDAQGSRAGMSVSVPGTVKMEVKIPKARTRGPYPLPRDHWYGPNDGTNRSHSGLQKRDREAVRQIQAVVGVRQDSIYGANTKAAVAAYQRARGLAADGLVGPKTWVRMTAGT